MAHNEFILQQQGKIAKPKFRLPNGSEFHAVYHDATKSWTGTLVVQGTSFTGTQSGIHHLLMSLSKKYQAMKKMLDSKKEKE
jgi:hypothetical protein